MRKIFVLFGQRKESYSGQYAPEAIAVADEIGYSENSEYLNGQFAKYEASQEFASLKIVQIKISDEQLEAILFPEIEALSGEIVSGS